MFDFRLFSVLYTRFRFCRRLNSGTAGESRMWSDLLPSTASCVSVVGTWNVGSWNLRHPCVMPYDTHDGREPRLVPEDKTLQEFFEQSYDKNETLDENIARYCRYRTHQYYEWAKAVDLVNDSSTEDDDNRE